MIWPPPPPTSLPRLRLACPCGLCTPPCPPGLSFTGVGLNAIGLTSPALLVKLGTPPMGVMFGGGWPGRLASGGMRGGGEGVAKEIEAELSEARESWPESHMLMEAHCNVTHSAAAPRRTSSPLDRLDSTGLARHGWLGGTNSFPTLCSSPPHFLLTPLSPMHQLVP